MMGRLTHSRTSANICSSLLLMALGSLIALSGIAMAGDSTTLSRVATNKTYTADVFQTYAIIYADVEDDRRQVRCSRPGNATAGLSDSGNIVQIWNPPSGVAIETSAENEVTDTPVRVGPKSSSGPWVELGESNVLVFHNPDVSLSGPYVCSSRSGERLLHQTIVWVHVLRQNVFDYGERFKVAFIVAAVFLACVLGLVYVNRRFCGSKTQYSPAACNDDHQIDIPTIRVLGSSVEKHQLNTQET